MTETKGYDMSSKIYINLGGNCFNRTHRFAFCSWFGIKEVPAVIVKKFKK